MYHFLHDSLVVCIIWGNYSAIHFCSMQITCLWFCIIIFILWLFMFVHVVMAHNTNQGAIMKRNFLQREDYCLKKCTTHNSRETWSTKLIRHSIIVPTAPEAWISCAIIQTERVLVYVWLWFTIFSLCVFNIIRDM